MFQPGKVVATPGAIALAIECKLDLLRLIERHISGDWGDLCDEDKRANYQAVQLGGRIISAYNCNDRGGRIWVITEHDRSVTTILLPSEY